MNLCDVLGHDWEYSPYGISRVCARCGKKQWAGDPLGLARMNIEDDLGEKSGDWVDADPSKRA